MPLNGLNVIIAWIASYSVVTAALTISPPSAPTSSLSTIERRQALLPTISHEPYHVRNGSSSGLTTTAPGARSDPALPSYGLPFIVTVGSQVISIPLTVSSGRLVEDSGQILGPTSISTINNTPTSLVLTQPATVADSANSHPSKLPATTIAQTTPPETITLALEDIAPSSAGILLEPDSRTLVPGGPAATLEGEILSLLPSFKALVIDGTTYPLATATTWSAPTADAATDTTATVIATRTASLAIATATAGSASTTVAAASLALANTTAAITAKANATARITASEKPVLVAGKPFSTSPEETLTFSETLSFSFLSHSSSVTSSSTKTSLSLPVVSFVVPITNGVATAGSGRAGGSARPTSMRSGAGVVGLALESGVGCVGVSLLVVLRMVGL